MFTHPETKDGWTTGGRNDGHTDVRHETIMTRHYRMPEYKKGSALKKNKHLLGEKEMLSVL